MSPGLRLSAFAAAVALVFGLATLAGAALDPDVRERSDEHEEGSMGNETTHAQDTESQAHGAGAESHNAHGAGEPAGLAAAQVGYRLAPLTTIAEPSAEAPYRFKILDDNGRPVRAYDVTHERRMHLILVRRDFTEFQHLHPRQGADGTWETTADLSVAGTYRVFADFSTRGETLTLATDLFVPGDFHPAPLPEPARTASAGDGYEVKLAGGKARTGEPTPLRFRVFHDGEPVDSVEPYLGADGHLVALREHDQAFLHTHPEGEAGGSGPIEFDVSYPTPGRYRLYLQFKHEGEVRTAEFTQAVGKVGDVPANHGSGAGHGGPGHGH